MKKETNELTFEHIRWRYGLSSQYKIERNMKVWYYYHKRYIPGPLIAQYEPWGFKTRQKVNAIVNDRRLTFIMVTEIGLVKLKPLLIDPPFEEFIAMHDRIKINEKAQKMRDIMEEMRQESLVEDRNILKGKLNGR